MAEVNVRMFPGEAEAIEEMCDYGSQYGYGNLISRLKDAWATMIREKYDFDSRSADLASGHICIWCGVDSRTGEKVVDS